MSLGSSSHVTAPHGVRSAAGVSRIGPPPDNPVGAHADRARLPWHGASTLQDGATPVPRARCNADACQVRISNSPSSDSAAGRSGASTGATTGATPTASRPSSVPSSWASTGSIRPRSTATGRRTSSSSRPSARDGTAWSSSPRWGPAPTRRPDTPSAICPRRTCGATARRRCGVSAWRGCHCCRRTGLANPRRRSRRPSRRSRRCEAKARSERSGSATTTRRR